MTTNRTKLTTRFAPDTRFDVTPQPAAPYRANLRTELELLQERLLRGLLQETPDTELHLLFRRVVSESAALVAKTGFPLLLLPMLVEERTEAVRRSVQHDDGTHKNRADRGEVAA